MERSPRRARSSAHPHRAPFELAAHRDFSGRLGSRREGPIRPGFEGPQSLQSDCAARTGETGEGDRAVGSRQAGFVRAERAGRGLRHRRDGSRPVDDLWSLLTSREPGLASQPLRAARVERADFTPGGSARCRRASGPPSPPPHGVVPEAILDAVDRGVKIRPPIKRKNELRAVGIAQVCQADADQSQPPAFDRRAGRIQ